MITRYTLLGISLFLGAQLITGCSQKNPQLSKRIEPTNEHVKQKESPTSGKQVFDTNTKIATEISNLEKKIVALEKEISQTPLGTQRAKLVKDRSQLEEKVLTLRSQQIDNAKTFKISKQKEQNQREENKI
jgi:outer membrane murein-binding lipoprotein Lpp